MVPQMRFRAGQNYLPDKLMYRLVTFESSMASIRFWHSTCIRNKLISMMPFTIAPSWTVRSVGSTRMKPATRTQDLWPIRTVRQRKSLGRALRLYDRISCHETLVSMSTPKRKIKRHARDSFEIACFLYEL